jgi:hypothetical protein
MGDIEGEYKETPEGWSLKRSQSSIERRGEDH